MPGIIPFAFPCRKCLPCRLNIAREKAVRCWHEAKIHEDSIFLTLTYSEQHLKSPQLQYIDFQIFMDSLRKQQVRGITDKELRKKFAIPYMVTGEYGEKNKRPHWHALLFNYRPKDEKKLRTDDLNNTVWESQTLTDLWGKGKTEYGSVTLESAGYVARYAAKKLVHGNDQDHQYHPIHKTSSAHAIGKKWIEKNFEHTFNHGFIVLPNGTPSKIPRYYEDWYKKHHYEKWLDYVTQLKSEISANSEKKNREELEYYIEQMNAAPSAKHLVLTRSKVKETILKSKFKILQERLKNI